MKIPILLCLLFFTHFKSTAQPKYLKKRSYQQLNMSPNWSPDGNSIVFISKRDGNKEVYIMDSDGSNQRRLTNTLQSESQPSWSPDGNKILFNSERSGALQIFIMDRDGSNQTNLTNTETTEFTATWSPTGEKIAFSSTRDGIAQVFIMNPDGTNPQRVSKTNTSVSYPIWSPDGNKIVCMSFAPWNGKIDYIKYNFLDNSSYSLFEDFEAPHRFYDWSKNDKILYTKKETYAQKPSPGKIFISNSDMTNVQRQSKNINDLIAPSFSPQGDRVLYYTLYNVFVLTIGERKPMKVAKRYSSAKWSPDGQYIVMVSRNLSNIYTIKSDGTELKQLTFNK